MSGEYFSELNYSLANEDNYLEYMMVKDLKPKSICSVCGSGGRSLPLIIDSTDVLDLCDLSRDQIRFAQLKESSYKTLNYREFLKFWGYPENLIDSNQRKEIYLKLLDEEKREYLKPIFESNEWREPIYYGKWEKAFIIFSKIIRFFMRNQADELFEQDNIEGQKKFYREKFSKWRWSLVLRIVGQKATMDAFLYKGNFIKKNLKQSYYNFYQERFGKLFETSFAKNNFFLQILFKGKMTYLEALPVEADEEVFNNIKSNTTCKIHYHQESIFNFMEGKKDFYEFVSLSDVPSYLGGDIERDFLNMIYPSLKIGCIVISRYYLRISDVDSSKFTDVTNEYTNLIDTTNVNVYDIKIYKKEQ